MDDSQKPKPDVSPVFITRADLPADLPPPIWITKQASSEDFHTSVLGTSDSSASARKKSGDSSNAS